MVLVPPCWAATVTSRSDGFPQGRKCWYRLFFATQTSLARWTAWCSRTMLRIVVYKRSNTPKSPGKSHWQVENFQTLYRKCRTCRVKRTALKNSLFELFLHRLDSPRLRPPLQGNVMRNLNNTKETSTKIKENSRIERKTGSGRGRRKGRDRGRGWLPIYGAYMSSAYLLYGLFWASIVLWRVWIHRRDRILTGSPQTIRTSRFGHHSQCMEECCQYGAYMSL
jgi:hypothetical protein